ncbi:DUF5806 family protein [Saliphagus sp. GCM10025334]
MDDAPDSGTSSRTTRESEREGTDSATEHDREHEREPRGSEGGSGRTTAGEPEERDDESEEQDDESEEQDVEAEARDDEPESRNDESAQGTEYSSEARDEAATSEPPMPGVPDPDAVDEDDEIPADVQKYARFQKMDGAQYDRVNEFLRDRTYVTAREWAIARLCSDFRTETGVEMTKIGENLPELVPFMTDTYTPQAVNQARSSFEEKVRKSGATFLYGAMCDFFTAEELDDVMYEATEVAKFLLEVEGVDLSVEDELEAEERISSVMREVREASKELREEDT